jgi:hypothetical protein
MHFGREEGRVREGEGRRDVGVVSSFCSLELMHIKLLMV